MLNLPKIGLSFVILALTLALFSVAIFFFFHFPEVLAQDNNVNDDIIKYEMAVRQSPADADAHKNLGFAYARKGEVDKAKDELDKAIKLEYARGYEDGREDTIKKETRKIYAIYVFLSIVVGLLIAALIVSILSWADLSDRYRTILKNSRIRNYVKGINANLDPKLRQRAIEIAQSKEKLRHAISRETDANLIEATSAVLPRLDDLTRQASLLLELQQNLSDYVKDMDPAKLEMSRQECEERIKRENDQEAKAALEYQLKQINNQRANYSKAQAKLRTCDAVLNGIAARINATSLDLMSLPSLLIKKQEFFERISAELDEELKLTRNAAETVNE